LILQQEIKLLQKKLNINIILCWEIKSISTMAYNLETILAEKLEAIISRGGQTTRLKDYYDIYILNKLQNEK